MLGVTGILNVLFITNVLSDFDERLELVIKHELGIEVKLKLHLQQQGNYKELHESLKKSIDSYNFVIFSARKQVEEIHIAKTINYIPAEKLILIHSNGNWLNGSFSTIYRDERQNIFNALVSLNYMANYKKIFLLKNEVHLYSKSLLKGITDFADNYKLELLLKGYKELVVDSKYVYILYSEQELYKFLKILKNHHNNHSEVSLLSLSDSLYREVLPNFIHYLAPDISKMGKLIAEIIKNGGIQHKMLTSSFVKKDLPIRH